MDYGNRDSFSLFLSAAGTYREVEFERSGGVVGSVLVTISRKAPFVRIRRGIVDRKELAYRVFEQAFLKHTSRLESSSRAKCPEFQVIMGNQRGLRMAIPDRGGGGALERRFKKGNALNLRDVFLRHQWADGGLYIDIGANVGLTSLPHALFGGFSQVIAIEPEPRNFDCLRYNAARNSLDQKIELLFTAVGEKKSKRSMSLSYKSGCHYLVNPNEASEKAIEIPVLTLDEIVARQSCRISLVKCDTQGYEAHVLAGAQELLRRRTAGWFIEVWPAGLARSGSTMEEFLELVESHFDWFADRNQDRPLVLSIDLLKDHLSGLKKDKFTDLILIP